MGHHVDGHGNCQDQGIVLAGLDRKVITKATTFCRIL
jgi:hypothetical protein